MLGDGVERVTSVIGEEARVPDVAACLDELQEAGATIDGRVVTFPSGERYYAYRMVTPVRGLE